MSLTIKEAYGLRDPDKEPKKFIDTSRYGSENILKAIQEAKFFSPIVMDLKTAKGHSRGTLFVCLNDSRKIIDTIVTSEVITGGNDFENIGLQGKLSKTLSNLADEIQYQALDKGFLNEEILKKAIDIFAKENNVVIDIDEEMIQKRDREYDNEKQLSFDISDTSDLIIGGIDADNSIAEDNNVEKSTILTVQDIKDMVTLTWNNEERKKVLNDIKGTIDLSLEKAHQEIMEAKQKQISRDHDDSPSLHI